TATQPFTRFSLPPATAPSPTELAACPWPLGLLDLSGNRLLDDSADLMAAIMQQLVEAAGGSVLEAAVRACQRLAALLGRPPLQLHLADNHYPFSLPQLRALSSTLAAAAAPPYVAGFLACTSPSGTLPGPRATGSW
ncbi:hypothetical protein HaLaN_17984, partial [Haematococcus lacustris]